MRVSAMVLGILLAIWTFFEALLAGWAGDVSGDDSLAAAAGLGLIACFFIGVGALLVLAVPQVSMVLFAIGAAMGYGAAGLGWGNQWLYATLMAFLAVMAFFGWRGKKRDQREKQVEQQRQLERDQRLEALLHQQQQSQRSWSPPAGNGRSSVFCTACGAPNSVDSKFCAECGSPLVAIEGAS